MIQSVCRALQLLEVLGEAGEDGRSLGDLSRRTALKAPTAHNLLRTLVTLGYAAYDPGTRRYALGEKIRILGRRRFLDAEIAAAARPVLQDLQATIKETFIVALFREGQRYTVASVESEQDLRVGAREGVDSNLYMTATGRLLLSRTDRASLENYLKDHGLPGDEWPEAATRETLDRELKRIREARFALCDRHASHTRALAVPIEIVEPGANIALGVYYPSMRAPRGGVRRLRRCLTEAAGFIAANYGEVL